MNNQVINEERIGRALSSSEFDLIVEKLLDVPPQPKGKILKRK